VAWTGHVDERTWLQNGNVVILCGSGWMRNRDELMVMLRG
jgi:hypothetical protein